MDWEMGLEMRPFYAALGNTLVASVINNFVWFAVTFWVFLQTRSVVATSIMAGVFTLTIALSGLFLGSIVDRYPKKTAMMLSSFASTVLYLLAAMVYIFAPPGGLADPSSAASVGLHRLDIGRGDGRKPARHRPLDPGDGDGCGRQAGPGQRPGRDRHRSSHSWPPPSSAAWPLAILG